MGKTLHMHNAFNQDRTYGHIDLSTGDAAPHVVKYCTLKTRLEERPGLGEIEREWNFGIRMPMTIADALESADYELVCRCLDTRVGDSLSPIEAVIVSALLTQQTSERLQMTVCSHIAANLYRIFCQKQVKKGNKAWLAPSSMNDVGGRQHDQG